MFTRRDNKGRLYLYALGQAGQAVSVVDITDAARPSIVSQVPYSGPAGYGNVQTLGMNTALVEMPDQVAAPTKRDAGEELSAAGYLQSRGSAHHATLRGSHCGFSR